MNRVDENMDFNATKIVDFNINGKWLNSDRRGIESWRNGIQVCIQACVRGLQHKQWVVVSATVTAVTATIQIVGKTNKYNPTCNKWILLYSAWTQETRMTCTHLSSNVQSYQLIMLAKCIKGTTISHLQLTLIAWMLNLQILLLLSLTCANICRCRQESLSACHWELGVNLCVTYFIKVRMILLHLL